MRIGICDDDRQDLSLLDSIISELRHGDEIVCFSESAALLKTMRNGLIFDCLFLDILMPELNGMEIASAIRKEFPDKEIYVIFITSSKDYAIEAFAHKALHYIVKPFTVEQIAEAFSRIPAHSSSVRRQGIQLRTGGTRRFLYLDELAFCESGNHKVYLKLVNGEILTVAQTFEQFRKQLGDSFLWISRGILVNPNYIATMERLSCTLQDGRKILLSRGRLKQIQEKYDNFIFEQLTK